MKIHTSKISLHTVTGRIQSGFGEKSTSHAYVSMKANADGLVLLAEDWLLSIYSGVDCQVVEQGECHISAALFLQVVRELPEGEIVLEAKDGMLVLTATASSQFYFKLPLVDHSWRAAEPLLAAERLAFNPIDLEYMIGQVATTIQLESPRPYATVGCFHKTSEGSLRLVASDGYMLSYCDLRAEAVVERFPNNICVGKRGLLELQRICRETTEEDVGLYVLGKGKVLAVSTDKRQVYIRVSAVDFPRYESALPDETLMASSTIVRSELQTVVKRVLLATNRSSRGIELEFSANKLVLRAGKSSGSECQESLPIVNALTSTHRLDLNGKFVSNALATITYDKLNVYFNNDECPFVMTAETELPACRSKHIIQPIRDRT